MAYETEETLLDKEPRKVFLNLMIITLKEIERNIFFPGGSVVQATRMLRGMIKSLDKESNEKLKPLVKKLESYEYNLTLMTREDMESIYQSLMEYLHATYLREVRFARPKYSSEGKLEAPET